MLILRFLLVITILASSNLAVAQCGDWENLLHYKFARIEDADHDRYGHRYAVGTFFQYDFSLGSHTFTIPPGGLGVFIAKFDKNDALIWAISPTVNNWGRGARVEFTKEDDIVVAGDFSTSISFGCLEFHGSGNSDIFLVKLRPDGAPVWLTGSTGADNSSVQEIKLSDNGNCIVVGDFVERSAITPNLVSPDMAIGGVPVITGAVDQINAGYDSFIASVRPDGTVAWTQGVGGDGNAYDYIRDVATDSENNIIITGFFNSPQISMDGHVVHAFTISENFILAKINSEGQTQWVRETEGGINQSGWGVDTDADDNIYVAGRCYGNAKFGALTLPHAGQADAYIVKFSTDGTALAANSFGNDGYDAGTSVEVNSQGKVVLSAYYYSFFIELGPYISTQSDFSGDSFLATLNADLSQVECAKFVTGEGESIIWQFELDRYDNVIAPVSITVWEDHPVHFDANTFDDAEVSSVLAIIGDNTSDDEEEWQPSVFTFSLGNDTILCPGRTITLRAPFLCNAHYQWNTASNDNSIDVITPGLYWLDITINGITYRDEIVVSTFLPFEVALGDDVSICPGEIISWTLPVFEAAEYRWSDGTSSNQNSTTTLGTYWVEVSNGCFTARDEVTVTLKQPPSVDLGNDVVACRRDVTLRYAPKPGETVDWTGGSTEPELVVSESGMYQISVTNGCTEVTDEVLVTIKDPGELIIPNVVTFNGDDKNDQFVLPPDADGCSLMIFNRWGERIFFEKEYKNSWPTGSISSGIYFYSLHGDCVPLIKGLIHVIH